MCPLRTRGDVDEPDSDPQPGSDRLPGPRQLAESYAGITGWEIEGGGDWVQLRNEDGGATLAFQEAPDHRPPVWPSADRPQQLHLDFDVADLDESEERILALGARKTEHQPGRSFRVYLDPAGHPFCLVLQQPAGT